MLSPYKQIGSGKDALLGKESAWPGSSAYDPPCRAQLVDLFLVVTEVNNYEEGVPETRPRGFDPGTSG